MENGEVTAWLRRIADEVEGVGELPDSAYVGLTRLGRLLTQVSQREACELLKVSGPTLRRWEADGRIQSEENRNQRLRLYRRADIIRLLGVSRLCSECGRKTPPGTGACGRHS